MKKISKMEQARQYWKKMMDSNSERMSRGASNILKTISWAKGENWRRSDKKSKKTAKKK